MIQKYKKSFIFYRHAWLGSALLVGGIISNWIYGFNYVILGLYTVGIGFVISSIIVSYQINKHPENFEDERKELENLKDWD